MTKKEARTILHSVWGSRKTLSAHEVKLIEADATEGESALATCARIAGVDVSDVQPFDHDTIRYRVRVAEARDP